MQERPNIRNHDMNNLVSNSNKLEYNQSSQEHQDYEYISKCLYKCSFIDQTEINYLLRKLTEIYTTKKNLNQFQLLRSACILLVRTERGKKLLVTLIKDYINQHYQEIPSVSEAERNILNN